MNVKLDIGLPGGKSEYAPCVLKAAALECIDQYPNDFARCYIDGSATDGMRNGGYGVKIDWPDTKRTMQTSGSVGRLTCSFDCERKAFDECVNILRRRHERIPLSGAVIFCDCQALLRALSGQNLTGVSECMININSLRESGVELTAQWIPSHVGIPGNEIADTLANYGRSKAQPLVPASLAHCSQVVRQRLADVWKAAIERNDDSNRVVKLIEARSADESRSQGSAVQLFRLRVGHSLLREHMAKRRWVSSSKCRLCDADSESISHVLFRCPSLDGAREAGWGGTSLDAALWGSNRNTEQTVRLVNMFLRIASW